MLYRFLVIRSLVFFFFVVMVMLFVLGQLVKIIDLVMMIDDVYFFCGFGLVGFGNQGVFVVGGFDVDGDGFFDFVFVVMKVLLKGCLGVGMVYFFFGDGMMSGMFDMFQVQFCFLQIYGDQSWEYLGSEIWIDDVMGDGVGDFLFCWQDFLFGIWIGVGVFMIFVGGLVLCILVVMSGEIDLCLLFVGVEFFIFLGCFIGGCFGIWVCIGDFDGDGVVDLFVGVDQEVFGGLIYVGLVYVV